jgi:hypothetical protein
MYRAYIKAIDLCHLPIYLFHWTLGHRALAMGTR